MKTNLQIETSELNHISSEQHNHIGVTGNENEGRASQVTFEHRIKHIKQKEC